MKRISVLFLLLIPVFCFAQAFGFEDEPEEKSSILPFDLKIGGEIEAGPVLFLNDFADKEKAEGMSILDFAGIYASFDINGKNAQFFTGLNLSYYAFDELINGDHGYLYPPAILDEIWLKGFFGGFTVQAGLMKMRWGRMYSPGPLDVINPLDYSDLTNLTESAEMKIARPMVHASIRAGNFSSVEAVFMPNFAPHRFALEGRWMPGEYSNMTSVYSQGIMDHAFQKYAALKQFAMLYPNMIADIMNNFTGFSPEFPDTSTPDFFQTGLRFNTVIGPCDFGIQYFYGNYMRPSVSINDADIFIDDLAVKNIPYFMSGGRYGSLYKGNMDLLSHYIEYSRYHQIGADYSQVLAGFTLRAEFAANITNDITGDNGNIKNPFLTWAFGVDKDIFAGININLQINENIRLLDDKVNKNPVFDCEAESDATQTRLVIQISKNFFRDRLECKAVNIWDIESSGLAVVPSVAWVMNDARIELSSGIFFGDEESELGQYWENSYLKFRIVYSF